MNAAQAATKNIAIDNSNDRLYRQTKAAGRQRHQTKFLQQTVQPLRRAVLFLARVAGHDEFVFQAVLPAHQLGDGDLIALGFQVQAAQHIGDLAAQLAGVQGVAPQLGQRRAGQRQGLAAAQHARHLGLAAGHDHHRLRLLGQAKGNRVVGGGVAGVQGGDDADAWGQLRGLRGVGGSDVQKVHALKAELLGQCLRRSNQLGPGFNAVDVATRLGFEKQVVQDEAQVGLACAMVGQREGFTALLFFEQRLDELVQVVHLLELAPRVLVDLALAGEDVQLLQQRE